MQEVDRHGNVIPSDESGSPEWQPVNGVDHAPNNDVNALTNGNGEAEEKRITNTQDISLHNLLDYT